MTEPAFITTRFKPATTPSARTANGDAGPKPDSARTPRPVKAEEDVGPRDDVPLPVMAPPEQVQPTQTPEPPRSFTPTAFIWTDPTQIPRRQFIYGRHLIRGVVSATVAPGGVGKSSLVLVEAVAMAAGRDLLNDKPAGPLRVWYCNLEDDREEIVRRVAAICLHFWIKPDDLGDRLFIDGRDTVEITIAAQTKDGVTVAKPVLNGLTAALKSGKFDVLTLDPFVSAHRVSENDNMAIDAVVKSLAKVAGKAQIAVELVHHVRKTGGAEITAEDARGAGATVAAARSVRVLNRMDDEQAKKLGIDDKTRRRIFRMNDDKQNLAPAVDARWFHLHSVPLGNGNGGDTPDQDSSPSSTAGNCPTR